MSSKVPESTRLAYARQLADEAKTLVPSMERLGEIAAELRADDLFRLLGFDTWERFCTDYLGVSKWTANRWIAGPKQKSIGAGQKVAAVQNAPIVESDTLKVPAASTEAPDKSSEGGEQDGETRLAPSTSPPSGKSSEGGVDAGTTPGLMTPTAPSDPPDAVPGSSDPAFQRPLNPPELEADVPVDVDAIGLRWLKSKTDRQVRALADPLGPAIRGEIRRWAVAFGFMDGRAARRQGTITRPKAVRLERNVPPERVPAHPGYLPTKPLAKRHADDCSCLSCVPPKAAAK